MIALLGNFKGEVEVPGLKGFVWARTHVYHTIDSPPKMEEMMIDNNGVVPALYDLPVVVADGKVIRMCGQGELKHE